jgi:biotin transport system substrate-specific component
MSTNTQVVNARSLRLADVGAVGLFAALTALSARIVIPVPYTPVPVTLQVLAVILAGLALGSRRGAASQVVYLAATAAGLPWTASGLGGPAAFVGPTAGYLIGFVPAAFVVGWLAERMAGRWNVLTRLLAALGGVAVIYTLGMGWLVGWLGGDLQKAWQMGVTPFLAVDAVKALLAAMAESGRAFLAATGRDG